MLSDLLDLRILPTDRVLPHEVADPKRKLGIEQRLRKDGILRDPVIAGSVTGGRFILLDGTNRRSALANLGLPNLLAQVVDYGDERVVILKTWCHEVALSIDALLGMVESLENVVVSRVLPLGVGDGLAGSSALAVVLDGRDAYAVMRAPDSSPDRAPRLRQIVEAYEPLMRRVDCEADLVEERAQTLPAGFSLVAFPSFARWEVVAAAMKASLIPAGITRHVVLRGRALRVNLPLGILEDADLDVANTALREHLSDLQPRLYREPTYLYDS